MSNNRQVLDIPDRWLHCPRKAVDLVAKKFFAFKTPLSSDYDSQVPLEHRWSPSMLFGSLKGQRIKLGLWIDLTNTNRFYNKQDIEATGCGYVKLPCRGHGETPSEDQAQLFVQICRRFISQNPLDYIGVHCTHGFNRTGFLICCYLVETTEMSIDSAITAFAVSRPPGIYKGDYVQELYRRYDDIDDAPAPPAKPAWCLEYDDSTDDNESSSSADANNSHPDGPARKRRKESNNKNAVFMAGVPGVSVLDDMRKLSGIQRRVQEILHWEKSGFPGSQPVSMDVNNIVLLHQKPYRVSWKADGTRYMMLIQGDGEVFFLDRDNNVFQVKGLTFPHPQEQRIVRDTLLDGEMVIDKAGGKEYPRYLAYDIMMFDGKDVTCAPFFPERYSIIERKIIGGRTNAFRAGKLRRESEPFSVRLKQFWDVTQTSSLLGDKFAKQLGHEPDGLVFQPEKEPYTPGPSPDVLKWKPISMNSVDFRLKIVTESGTGIVPRKVGHLYVGGLNVPFAVIKISKQLKELDNKIIECRFEDGKWIYMRERTDKSFPNSMNTAQAVCSSIREPVTTEKLVDYIDRHRFSDDSDLMPPPGRNVNNARTVFIWCTKEMSVKDRKTHRINIDYDHATLVRWSPDRKALIIHKSLANNIEVYKLCKKANGFLAAEGKALEFPKRHADDVVGMEISSTGRYIITCGKTNDLIVWDLKGQVLAAVDTYLGTTHRARISPCGRFVAASGFTPDVKVWEVSFTKSGDFKQVSKAFDLGGHSSGIYDFDFNTDSSRMVTVSKDGTYRLYDTKIEFEKGEDPRLLLSRKWEGQGVAKAALTTDAEVLVIAHGSSLSFYSMISGKLDTTIDDVFAGPITCILFDAAGEHLLAAGDKHVKVFRNIPKCRAAIESSNKKLEQKISSATKERLEKIIADSRAILEKMGEPCAQ